MKSSIRKRLFGGFGICVLLMVVTIGLILLALQKLEKLYWRSAHSTNDVIMATAAAHLGPDLYLIIADSIIHRNIPDIKRRWSAGKVDAEQQLRALEATVDEPWEVDDVRRARESFVTLTQIFEQEMLPLVMAGPSVAQQILEVDLRIDKEIDNIRLALENYVQLESAQNKSVAEEFETVLKQSLSVGLAVALVGIAFAVSVSALTARSIIRPVSELTGAALEMTKGNYDVKLECRQHDETGVLANAFRKMAERVQERTTELKESNQRLEHEIGERILAEKLLQKAYGELDGKVKERTAELFKANEQLQQSRDELEVRVRERTAELKRMNMELGRSNEALQEFAFIASHDLQEPLRKIQAFGTKLEEKSRGVLDDQSLDYLERIQNASIRMKNLIAALLSYSRIKTEAEPFSSVSLHEVASGVLGDLEARIAHTGAKMRLDELPAIEADADQMHALFLNLIGNALKYHRRGEAPDVHVYARQDGEDRVQIHVKDKGIGFNETNLERIFAPFQRLHGKGSEYEGTGMGLAICRKIVERHGGVITARSTPDEGSTFIITLPMKQTAISS